MPVQLSVVVAAFDEQDCVRELVQELGVLVGRIGVPTEVVVVDDGSTDLTLARTRALMTGRPWLRIVHLDQRYGQSAAVAAGIRAARGRWVATMDADLQNDPADLVRLLDRAGAGDCDWVQGVRQARPGQDVWVRSARRVVDGLRALLLGDGLRDPGCSLRLFRREVGLQLPLQFGGLHRFMPVYARRLGCRVVEVDVAERPRHAGYTKYTFGDELFASLFDLAAMRWMFVRLSRGRERELALPAPPVRGEEVSARSLDDAHPPV